jgi:hypothetical protein
MSLQGLLIYELTAFVVIVAVLTATGTPLVKFFVKPLSWTQALWVCGYSTLSGFGIYFVVIAILAVVSMVTGVGALRATFVGGLGIPAIIGCGGFISYFLRRQGFPQSFPGAGAKVVFGWVVLSWVPLGLAALAGYIAR